MPKYIDYIPNIILEPDYIGIDPNELGISIELVKRYADNIMIGIKLDIDGEYLYVPLTKEKNAPKGVPEMMDTPPIQNNYAFII